MAAAAEPDGRVLHPLLLLALLAMPGLFCWVVLRKGYRSSLRKAVFAYAGTLALIGVLGQLG